MEVELLPVCRSSAQRVPPPQSPPVGQKLRAYWDILEKGHRDQAHKRKVGPCGRRR